MNVQELVDNWQKVNRGERSAEPFQVHLPLKEAAQVMALAEMYPDCTVEQILTDLVGLALSELSQAFPYKAGAEVAQDEYGDPIYEDAGLTPQFIRLAQKHRNDLEAEQVKKQAS